MDYNPSIWSVLSSWGSRADLMLEWMWWLRQSGCLSVLLLSHMLKVHIAIQFIWMVSASQVLWLFRSLNQLGLQLLDLRTSSQLSLELWRRLLSFCQFSLVVNVARTHLLQIQWFQEVHMERKKLNQTSLSTSHRWCQWLSQLKSELFSIRGNCNYFHNNH